MTGRFLLLGAVLGGLTLFVWQAVSHVVIPWHDATLNEFTNADAVIEAIGANAPAPGVYTAREGLFAVVALDPAIPDRTQMMGTMLGRQLVLDVATALILSFLVLGLARHSAGSVALYLGAAGLAAGALQHFSLMNWFAFSAVWATVGAVDLAIGWMLTGFVLGMLAQRMNRGTSMFATAGRTNDRVTAQVH